MKVEEVKELIQALSESSLAELKYEDEEVKLSLKKANESIAFPQTGMEGPTSYFFAGKSADGTVHELTASAGMAGAQSTAQAGADTGAATEPALDAADGEIVTSPLVGTFYTAASEESEPYVTVGTQVKKGQVVAIVEAMKLMNEIESDYEGTVAEVFVSNGDTVEYGQPLFRVR